jgi:hypothetical protein
MVTDNEDYAPISVRGFEPPTSPVRGEYSGQAELHTGSGYVTSATVSGCHPALSLESG